MAKMIFVNLPVANLAKSTAFYGAIGAEKNPQFSNDSSACMVFSDTVHVMLLTHDRWRVFTNKEISDSRRSSEVMLALSCDERDAVDTMTEAAGANGGRSDVNPAQDHGFMYGRSFEDPDGHIWEAMWMDVSAIPDRAGVHTSAAH